MAQVGVPGGLYCRLAALVEISFTAHWRYQRYCDCQLRSWIVTRSLHQGLPLVDGFQCSCYDTAKCECDDLMRDDRSSGTVMLRP